ncbi:hypothetical protein NHQ30_001601 [Ciborinia camelliae]|nr:hypothetical protein NHQ30_001601 [Ciborinia camelliae]
MLYNLISLLTLLFLILLAHPTNACLIYHATAPFAKDKPFIGKIVDNGVETCWINMTYNEHWERQLMENEADWKRQEWAKLWEGKMKANTTDRKYYAEVGVGLRGVTYRAHGEKFWFNPDTVEDVEGERWVYNKKLWCPK